MKVASTKKEHTYPYIGISKQENIVLFTERKCGVLLAKGEKNTIPIGHYANNWTESDFEKFQGVVTLEND